MSKKVKIDIELYQALYDYFCSGKGADVDYIRRAIQAKQDSLVKHTMYSLSKRESLTEEQREYFRKQYTNLNDEHSPV